MNTDKYLERYGQVFLKLSEERQRYVLCVQEALAFSQDLEKKHNEKPIKQM